MYYIFFKEKNYKFGLFQDFYYINRMRKPKKIKREQFYIVVNQNGEAYIGMLHGKFQWSTDWEQAKLLEEENTTYIRYENSKIELIPEQEIL